MSTPTPELRSLIERAGADPVEFTDPETNTRFVLVRVDVFRKLLAEEERDLAGHEEWEELARKARDQWAREEASG